MTYFHIYLLRIKLKDWNIIDPYEITISYFENNVNEWLLIEHGAIVKYLTFNNDTIVSRRKPPIFTIAYYSGYRRLPGRYPNYGAEHSKIFKEIIIK